MRIRTFVAAVTIASSAHANIIERIVAVVDEHPILMSELRQRSAPEMKAPNAVESEVHQRVLEKMIVEQLVQKEAQRAHLHVSVDEIDRAVAAKLDELGLEPAQLASVLSQQGLTEQEYRDELRGQLLEGKLVQLRVAGRVRVTEQDARAAYLRWAPSFRASEPIDANVFSATNPPIQTVAVIQSSAPNADICDVARQRLATGAYECLQRMLLQARLPPAVRDQVSSLSPKHATPAIHFASGEVDIIQLLRRLEPPPFEEVREQMTNLAIETAVGRERQVYFAELRRKTYVDVRL
jgi:peptidyl-prolyl cis-trans isomerase SurA